MVWDGSRMGWVGSGLGWKWDRSGMGWVGSGVDRETGNWRNIKGRCEY